MSFHVLIYRESCMSSYLNIKNYIFMSAHVLYKERPYMSDYILILIGDYM